MKRICTALLCLTLCVGLLAGCGGSAAPADTEPGALKIVTTIFPLYDWVREILGERAQNAELTMLLDSGVDLHSYQPTVDDIIRISTCDVFIYVGGESDAWVDDALAEAVNPDMRVVNLMEVLGDAAKEEELAEGMQAEEEEEEEEEEEPEYDEHVWLSLRNAQVFCTAIAEALCAADPDNASVYQANASAYSEKLAALDETYLLTLAPASKNMVLFGDRFAFRYLVDDYHILYYAAFAGCSAETEASFETIVFLAEKVDEQGLWAILQQETSDGSIARTIRDNTASGDQEILTVNSMQGLTARDVAAGVTYLSVMEDNLEVFRRALVGG